MQYICVKGRGRARDLILDNPVMHARSLFGFVLLTYTLFTWPLAECEALSDDRESAMAIANNLQLGKIVLKIFSFGGAPQAKNFSALRAHRHLPRGADPALWVSGMFLLFVRQGGGAPDDGAGGSILN